jgi:hypothetical protein
MNPTFTFTLAVPQLYVARSDLMLADARVVPT